MTTTQIYELRQKTYKQLQRRHEAEIKALYPATGGSQHLFHNWHVCANDPQANAMRERFWAEDKAVSLILDRWYQQAEHRHHASRGWKPLWCVTCSGVREMCW